jgi:hypothetical protein
VHQPRDHVLLIMALLVCAVVVMLFVSAFCDSMPRFDRRVVRRRHVLFLRQAGLLSTEIFIATATLRIGRRASG